VRRERPIKVAIVGGGCAGITTAFELTRPEHAGKYQVTVYQQGFRLGGKGASGRGPSDRIEEHGLHLWMGFYENAFRLLRECYAELRRDPKTCRIATWQDALVPDPFCGVMDRSPGGAWLPWTVELPSLSGLPGDPGPSRSFGVADYLARSATLVLTLLQAIQTKMGGERSTSGAPVTPGAASDLMSRFLRYGEVASLTALLQGVEILDLVVKNLPEYPREQILQFHELVAGAVKRQLHARTQSDDEVRRLWEIVDLTLAVIRGVIRFGLVTDPRGFDAIDDYDCREWLRLNGASERSVDSAFVRALYDLAFAYEEGDTSRPRIAAGQALRGAVRAFFTYRGAFFWKMQSGMGDVIFAPFYEVLQRRGAKFEFFHRLRNIGLAPRDDASDGAHVRKLVFDVQARIKKGLEYRPLVDVRGLPCWPSMPDYDQLVDGARLRRERVDFESHWEETRADEKTLSVSKDFDFVVLAIGVGAIPYVAKELVERSEKWRLLVQHCKSVATQAVQLWMNEDMDALGWRGGPINVSGFVEPFDTWADMRQLIKEESFQPPSRAVAYFCSVLPDPPPGSNSEGLTYAAQRREEVRKNAITFLNRDIAHLWPNAVSAPGRFRWELLCTPELVPTERESNPGEERFSTQFWTANVNPSDRYSLSLPGTLKHRISPLDATFDNLTVAGDWTHCGFNEGCVEAAVMSGRLAAHAISELPRLEDIVGYDHP
jgi:uncharacterized protein with NAD-binding domain and iron-sulfur cluster